MAKGSDNGCTYRAFICLKCTKKHTLGHQPAKYNSSFPGKWLLSRNSEPSRIQAAHGHLRASSLAAGLHPLGFFLGLFLTGQHLWENEGRVNCSLPTHVGVPWFLISTWVWMAARSLACGQEGGAEEELILRVKGGLTETLVCFSQTCVCSLY